MRLAPQPGLWVRALDDERCVISSALLIAAAEHEQVRLYSRGELAGDLRLRTGDGAVLLERLGLLSMD